MDAFVDRTARQPSADLLTVQLAFAQLYDSLEVIDLVTELIGRYYGDERDDRHKTEGEVHNGKSPRRGCEAHGSIPSLTVPGTHIRKAPARPLRGDGPGARVTNNNQDHAMMTAMLTAKNILAGARVYDIWNVNEDAEYHEAGLGREGSARKRAAGAAEGEGRDRGGVILASRLWLPKRPANNAYLSN